jgi:hypothetical protein
VIFTALTRLRRYLVISACQPRETDETGRSPLFKVQLEQLSLQWRQSNRVVDVLQELEASVDCVHCEIAIFRRLQPSIRPGSGSADQEVYIQSGECIIKIVEHVGVCKSVVQIVAIRMIRQRLITSRLATATTKPPESVGHAHG